VLPGGSCAITVRMDTATGGTFSQGGIAVSGATTGNRTDLSLSGTVVAPTTLGSSPASLAFGTVTKGLSKSLTLTLSNTGGNGATGLGYAFANPAGAVVRGGYVYAPGGSGWGTCPAAGGTLAAGASCTVIVRYEADCTGGSNNGTLSISGANFSTLAVALTAATSSSGVCQ